LKSSFWPGPRKRVSLTYCLPGFFNASKVHKPTAGIINLEWKIVGFRDRFLKGSAEGRIRSEVGQMTTPNLRITGKAMRALSLAGTFSNPAAFDRWSKRFRQEVKD